MSDFLQPIAQIGSDNLMAAIDPKDSGRKTIDKSVTFQWLVFNKQCADGKTHKKRTYHATKTCQARLEYPFTPDIALIK